MTDLSVPCMVCRNSDKANHAKCVWCCLWVCSTCVEKLRQIEDRSLRELISVVVKRQENNPRADGQGDYTKAETVNGESREPSKGAAVEDKRVEWDQGTVRRLSVAKDR